MQVPLSEKVSMPLASFLQGPLIFTLLLLGSHLFPPCPWPLNVLSAFPPLSCPLKGTESMTLDKNEMYLGASRSAPVFLLQCKSDVVNCQLKHEKLSFKKCISLSLYVCILSQSRRSCSSTVFSTLTLCDSALFHNFNTSYYWFPQLCFYPKFCSWSWCNTLLVRLCCFNVTQQSWWLVNRTLFS